MKEIKTPSELYQLLQDVTHHIIAWAKPGMKMSEIDAEAHRMFGEYSQYFTHSLGHGVGIQIHESPRVSGKSDEILREGMVITIEPGIYFIQEKREKRKDKKAGMFGLRYEEMVLVDKDKLIVL